MSATVDKEINQRRLIDACRAAGLPRSHYRLNDEGTILHVLDGSQTRVFGCSSRTNHLQIEVAIHEIQRIAFKRSLIGRRAFG